MYTEKHYWKTIYTWIKYLNYEVVHRNQQDDEIWLANKRKQSVVVFKNGANTTQEVRFSKERIIDHQEDITSYLDFEPKHFNLYIFTEKTFADEHLDETDPIKLKVKVIREEHQIDQLLPNFAIKQLYSRREKQTPTFYKNRVLHNGELEKHMIKFAPVTYSLIAINVIIWLFMIVYLNHFSDIKLLDVGGLVHFNVVHGEWYRLISSIFLHYNFEHIFMNMLSLFIFGKIVESIIGSWRMLGIFIISGIFANFASLSFNTDTVSVGASGAIFGLIGAIIVFMYLSQKYDRKLIIQLLVVIAILILLSLLMSNVNIVAHIGGFIGGALITLMGYYFHKDRNRFWIVVIIILLLFIAAQIRLFTIKEVNIYNAIITKEMKKGNYSKADKMVDQTFKKNYADAQTYYLSGLITSERSSKSEGMASWKRGLDHYPDSGLLNYQLAVANRSLNDNDKAKKYIRKAVKIDPNNSDYKDLQKELSD
ncbi:rhomboid family intramembrane serine protease [Staphylococcus sp. Marseille-Q5304]|uniref:rhomboid family intramembrane serine protease n=1 Tax=Staphylococcus sp. Marseille-Q5304 TaxID=2942200 RepID=UPI0020746C52|nr:rhomboid family intramembrane serine protease [Staphylococcus sp. Marseille-Q5304]